MQINHKTRRILIENPRCASLAVATMFAMERIEGATPNMLPKAARKLVPDQWESYEKIIILRDPSDRFKSAVAALPADFFDGTPTFEEKAIKCLDLLAANSSSLPISFKPQSDWLTCKFDVMVAIRDGANFANYGKFGRPLAHLNVGPTAARKLTKETELRVLEAYAKDVAKFSDLLVWTPDPAKPRLISGPCKACAKLIADAANQAAEVPAVPAVVADTVVGSDASSPTE